MILSFFTLCLFTTSLDPKCYAPVNLPDPIENMTLSYVQVMTRHGMRTPIEILPNDRDQRGIWNCNPPNHLASRTSTSPSLHYRLVHHRVDERMIAYPPTCGNGDLTVEGMMMHYNIGSLYRRYLVDKLGFLPKKFDPRYFRFISSPVDRCFRSAESFIYGLYEPEDPNEVITIQTGSAAVSSLVVPGENCQEAIDYTNEFRHGPIYEEYMNKTYPILKDALNFFKLPKTYEGYDQLCSWVISFTCNEDPQTRVPSIINDTIIDQCYRVNAFNQYGMFSQAKSPGLFVSTAYRQAMKIADQAMANSNGQKFALLSAHDTTVAAYMTLLGKPDDKRPPPYASHLAMEIWRDDSGERYVRYIFNGDPVPLAGFDNQTLVRFDNFRHYIAPFADYCKNN